MFFSFIYPDKLFITWAYINSSTVLGPPCVLNEWFLWYCKSWKYSRYINFRVFRANSASANSKPAKIPCFAKKNILYAHFVIRRSCVIWPYVLMQMGYIGSSLSDTCFAFVLPSYIHTRKCIIHWMILTLCSTKTHKWASAQHEFNNPRICFWAFKYRNMDKDTKEQTRTTAFMQYVMVQKKKIVMLPSPDQNCPRDCGPGRSIVGL